MIEMLVSSVPVKNTNLIEANTTIQVGTLTEDQGHQSSIGGYIDLYSNLSKHWKAQVRLLVSLKLDETNSESIHFSNYLLDPSGENYALTNLAHVSYDNGAFSSDIGRILLNTPFADTDDFRMALNTFEGIQSRYQYKKIWKSNFIALNSMSGIDAYNIEKFSPFSADSSGLIAIGFTTLALENNIDLWAYHVDKIMDSYFARYQYHGSMNKQFDYKGTVAISYQKEQSDSKIGGMVISTDLSLEQDSNKLFFAYDTLSVDDNYIISDGFGAGPFMSAADLTSLGVASSLFPGNDIDAYKLMLGKTFTNNFYIEYGYSYFDIVDRTKDLFEQNLIIDWKVRDNINLHVVATLGEHRDRPMNFYFIRLRYLF